MRTGTSDIILILFLMSTLFALQGHADMPKSRSCYRDIDTSDMSAFAKPVNFLLLMGLCTLIHTTQAYIHPKIYFDPMSSFSIQVTGASGFLGAHVVHQLLEAGYRVRASARTPKVNIVKEGWLSYGHKFEVVAVDDLATGDLTDALKGVGAIVHVAAPLAMAGPPDVVISVRVFRPCHTITLPSFTDTTLSGAVDGTLNVLKQGYAAGVRKFVVTSSISTAFDVLDVKSTVQANRNSWNPASVELAREGKYGPGYTYGAAKLPPNGNFGHLRMRTQTPTSPVLVLPAPRGKYSSWLGWADVRDVARAHVRALSVGPLPDRTHKRLLLGEFVDYPKAVEYILEQRPELKGRTVDPKDAPWSPTGWVSDLDITEQVLGIKREEFYSWQEMVLAAVDATLTLEKEWAAKGLTLDI
ncbi:hypothetical protein B0F90DRAFT_1916110 [Multifurca ochricompacta]|uniref:NAD(P)-binding domain-containing protein n=1 Tax=Multifurca ochricompacta TaxID=376703 RepID=A0AAD4M8B7_9AGAM|nr:hypothetical protein B0F90DRAFT_1916110 [Multifurca ochricompacta]